MNQDDLQKATKPATSAPHEASRTERDTMGELQVPRVAYYGVQTARAVHNFPISGLRFPRPMLRALGLIKLASAQVNEALGFLDPKLAKAIVAAAQDGLATGAGIVSGQLFADPGGAPDHDDAPVVRHCYTSSNLAHVGDQR